MSIRGMQSYDQTQGIRCLSGHRFPSEIIGYAVWRVSPISLELASLLEGTLSFSARLVTHSDLFNARLLFRFRARSSQAVLRHLSSQQFDLGFTALDTDHPAVKRRPAYTAPMQAVLPVGHPLGRKIRLEPGDFHEQPFVALGAEIATRSETDIFLATGNARPCIVAEAQLSASIRELLANGAGLSIVEPVTAANFAASGRVLYTPNNLSATTCSCPHCANLRVARHDSWTRSKHSSQRFSAGDICRLSQA
ncbi:LysR substrate-binding domain-containing protein [Primorskyibacter flagellatus]|uniref:LysR substrate binding domain-containing protein n=1 Tax=Primorskyibacter flagellatus TaxID=1387277 RepID=A0A1W2CAQ2_9RHOB|nr:LysR substrate-binding domain-containing protein [Primorskyibacter flagellatus]SMC82176.1 LysR substrate binding domain-containing protein [Primorskyibacter flagellatus]